MNHQEQMDEAIKGRRLYFIGEELPKDWYAAFKQWLPLAESGDAKAQFNIGRCYDRGDGVEDDKEKALEWYLKAASQEDPRAHYNLYLWYKENNELEKSKEYFDKALALNDYRAVAKVKDEDIKRKNDEVARIKKEAADKKTKKEETQREFERIQYKMLAEAVEKTNEYLKNNDKYQARGVLIALSKEDGFEFVKDMIPYFDLECVSYKFIKELKGMSTSWSPIIKDGNSDAIQRVHESYKFRTRVKIKNCSNVVLNVGAKIEYSTGEKVSGDIEPNETLEFETYWPLYKKQLVFPEGNGANSGKGLDLLFKFGDFEQPESFSVTKTPIFGCFVLTACFDDEDHPVVMTFRKFRDEKLLPNKFGAKFVKFYYEYGPAFANYIADKPKVKKAFRKVFGLIEKLIK